MIYWSCMKKKSWHFLTLEVIKGLIKLSASMRVRHIIAMKIFKNWKKTIFFLNATTDMRWLRKIFFVFFSSFFTVSMHIRISIRSRVVLSVHLPKKQWFRMAISGNWKSMVLWKWKFTNLIPFSWSQVGWLVNQSVGCHQLSCQKSCL